MFDNTKQKEMYLALRIEEEKNHIIKDEIRKRQAHTTTC